MGSGYASKLSAIRDTILNSCSFLRFQVINKTLCPQNFPAYVSSKRLNSVTRTQLTNIKSQRQSQA